MNPRFWSGKTVFLTGHTGFKGAWLTLWLEKLGARVTGYSLAPATDPALFTLLEPFAGLESIIADVRDRDTLATALTSARPEIVIHMAAQSLVRASYVNPAETLSTNVMGTVHLLDAIRAVPTVRAVLVITSDKVYRHDDGNSNFVEADPLGGNDPYSASKAAQEIITASFARSYFDGGEIAVATSRAGNVIGGGDWAADRLIPDYFRSMQAGIPFMLRYPEATRPWQYVLEPLSGYLMYLEHLYLGANVPPALNFGPEEPPVTVADVIAKLATISGHTIEWSQQPGEAWPEQDALRLDSAGATKALKWRPRLNIDDALRWTADWYHAHLSGAEMRSVSLKQIDDYDRRLD